MKVSEPLTTYGSHDATNLESMRQSLIASIQSTTDEKKLAECLSVFHPMPCVFSDDEMQEELRQAEESGVITDAEMQELLAKWES